LQFYSKSRFEGYYDLGNGFSDTYDLCKSKGDFHWMEYDGLLWSTAGKLMKSQGELENCENVKLPIKKGTIYVSAIYVIHVYQCFIWAKQHPDIKFIVGGPALISELFIMREEYPSNMTLTTDSVEQLFNVPNFSGEWKLDIPEKVKDEDIVFAYTLDTTCYWKKCTYCNYAFCRSRVRDDVKFGFENLKHNGLKTIKLNSPAFTPKMLREIIPKLPIDDLIKYNLYIRSGKAENIALREIIKDSEDKSMIFVSGIEYPSDRVLKMINKGITVNEILDTIDIFKTSKHDLYLIMILFWDDLHESDIEAVAEFMNHVPVDMRLGVTRIFVKPYTQLYGQYEVGTEVNIGPFHLGYIPKISEEQMGMSRRVREIIRTHPNLLDYTKGNISYE